MFLQLVAISVVCSLAHAIVCPPNVCSMVDCMSVTNCNGRVVSGGGYCGCCDTCVTELAEGERCGSMFLLGVPSHVACESHLICDVHTMTCQKPHTKRDTLTCAEKKAQLQGSSSSLLGVQHLECNFDGTYKAKQCQGSQCYCVDSEGNDIGYHTNIGKSQPMNCQCARDFDAYKKSGLIGRLFNCAPNGNYQQYRCLGSVCYCVDDNGNHIGTKSVNIGLINDLDCSS
ncbi:uncharacterized protein LOC121385645 [Gigantopelta aegis]|uniref:uncharacterized protein LOC121385645 n=1 Tax=Gigantopelta aegis TaxID=1735272 RepID=UPI001B889BBB|nr:uncharacterized protein LOC121385645 [Gigantopelta aegis]